MKHFTVDLQDSAFYHILADTPEEALEQALEWFSERKPLIVVEELEEIGHIHCPANGWDCPYWKDGICTLYPEHDPRTECDDFGAFWDGGDDYICNCGEEEL